MASLKKPLAYCFDLFMKMCVGLATGRIRKELARRNSQRGGGDFRWFTPEEAAVAEALGRIIVPSDDETPGFDEVCVLDPPAIVSLDKLVATSSHRQEVYSRGLLSFDHWALKERKRKFSELPKEDQTQFFRAALQILDDWPRGRSVFSRVWHRFRTIRQTREGKFYSAQLYSQIRSDCLQVFYTSRVSWTWLEYDGPPMEEGYQSLFERRESAGLPRAATRWNG
jgi:hypothetical protein